MDEFDSAELEILRSHEKILEKRKALMEGSQCFSDFTKSQIENFLWDSKKAGERNIKLYKKLTDVMNLSPNSEINSKKAKLDIMRHDYWTLVRTTFPTWYEEFKSYNSPNASPCKSPPEHGLEQDIHPNQCTSSTSLDRSKVGEATNQRFHKSWKEVKDCSPTTSEECSTTSSPTIKRSTRTTSSKSNKEKSDTIDNEIKVAQTPRHSRNNNRKQKPARFNV